MSFSGKKILITGGTGSMGKVLTRRILSGELGLPQKIIIFSRDEAKQHDMRVSYLNKTSATDEVIYNNFRNLLEFRIGDVRNYQDVCSAVRDVDIVVNAAALKQVPTCEYFVDQAVMTNCQGASNIVRAINENNYKVETVIGISTDKAVKPVNVMGMTKSIQERIFISANILNPKTRFICVRYGNVLASRGSVIPLFRHQLTTSKNITITVPSMTRFLISLNDAVDTVFAAYKEAKSGEIFVPNAVSATVENIAKALIGDRKDITIQITGIRPGEKMHEILISDEEAPYSQERGKYYAISSMLPELNTIQNRAEPLLKKEFSSADVTLSLDNTYLLLESNQLLPNQNGHLESGELLK